MTDTLGQELEEEKIPWTKKIVQGSIKMFKKIKHLKKFSLKKCLKG